ncbi:hypothetical protein AgCh_018283 [Apium graveolens]
MPGIDAKLITHRLNVDPTRKAVQQKKRTYAPNRHEAIKQEVEKLLEAGFIEEVLHEVELNYYTTEKFALIIASMKLRPYLQAEKIEVLTDQPLRNIIHSSKANGRLIKWETELDEFEIKYKPRTTIKDHTLAEFMVQCTINDQEVGGKR